MCAAPISGFLPALTNDGKIILQSKGSMSIAPDGNGGIYRALKVHGILDRMLESGIQYIQAFNVDNILIKVRVPWPGPQTALVHCSSR